jgi:hypothetical protein
MGEGMRERVRQKYAGLAVANRGVGGGETCCGSSCGCGGSTAEKSVGGSGFGSLVW